MTTKKPFRLTDLDREIREAIDVEQLLAERNQVAVVWSVEDVKHVRPRLTDEQAWDVLHYCLNKHDCEYGFTWCYIEDVADLLFPKNDGDFASDAEDDNDA
jgi:hypothetical protein